MMNLPVQDQSVAKAPAGPNGSHASLLRGDLYFNVFEKREEDGLVGNSGF